MTKRKHSRLDNEWIFAKEKDTIFLQSKILLENNFSHAFFTKKTTKYHPKEFKIRKSEESSIHFLRQVHGNKIIKASQTNLEAIKDGDGLITDSKKQSLWIYSADCIPILIGDSETGLVAAIHSGWRGLTKNIIRNIIKEIEAFGCKKNNLIIALGPSITGGNYQVNMDVINKIYKCTDNSDLPKKKDLLKKANSLEYIQYCRKDKFFLDIRLLAKEQLINEGIKKYQISINTNCTYSDSDLFHSWRREKTSNRQWSFIQSRERKIF